MQDWQYPALDFGIYSETEGLLCADAVRHDPKLKFVLLCLGVALKLLDCHSQYVAYQRQQN